MTHCKTVFLVGHAHSGADFLSKCLTSIDGVINKGNVGSSDSIESIGEIVAGAGNASHALLFAGYDAFETGNNARNPDLINWIAENNVPVIHFVRENSLDCLACQWAESESVVLDVEQAIQQISNLRAETCAMQKALQSTNCLELRFDQLVQPNGAISKLTAYQVRRLLQIDLDTEMLNLIRMPKRQTEQREYELKLQIRPELTRFGYGNLFELPRAA